MKIDRPQKFSNIVPALYGFVPQTICREEVAEYCMEKTGRDDIIGDDDPLDICVLTEREITHGNIIVQAIPIGGFRMIDGGEADDKIIAVLERDHVWANVQDISELPTSIVERLLHYFSTYKVLPREESKVHVGEPYGRDHAEKVIESAIADYQDKFERLVAGYPRQSNCIGQVERGGTDVGLEGLPLICGFQTKNSSRLVLTKDSN